MLQGGGADMTRELLHYAVQSQHNLTRPLSCIGVRGGAAGGGTELLPGMSRVLSRWGQWGIIIDFRLHYGPGVYSACNRN